MPPPPPGSPGGYPTFPVPGHPVAPAPPGTTWGGSAAPQIPQAPGYGYGYPGQAWGAPQPRNPTNGLAIASLVTGILSLVLFWMCFGGLALAIAAVILGVFGRRKARETGSGGGMALAGLITGAIGVVIGALVLVFLFTADSDNDFNRDPSNGVCNQDRFFQDPDC